MLEGFGLEDVLVWRWEMESDGHCSPPPGDGGLEMPLSVNWASLLLMKVLSDDLGRLLSNDAKNESVVTQFAVGENCRRSAKAVVSPTSTEHGLDGFTSSENDRNFV